MHVVLLQIYLRQSIINNRSHVRTLLVTCVLFFMHALATTRFFIYECTSLLALSVESSKFLAASTEDNSVACAQVYCIVHIYDVLYLFCYVRELKDGFIYNNSADMILCLFN